MAHWMLTFKRDLFNWVSIRNYVVVSASPLDIHKPFNCVWECPGTHNRRTGLAFMFSLFLPPRWCFERIPGILHTRIVWIWCVLLILMRWHEFEPIPAHLHHVWEIYNKHGRTAQALRRAIFSTRKELPNRQRIISNSA
jgi:hypothetical protein